MSAWRYMTRSDVVSGRPCVLLSVIVTTDGGGPGKIVLYDEHSAVEGQIVATLLCPANQSIQFRFDGLELSRGLYMQLVEKADYITIEWKPAGSRLPAPS